MASVLVSATACQDHAPLPGTVTSIYLFFHLQRAAGLKGGEAEPSMLPAGPSISHEGHSLISAQEQGVCPVPGHQQALSWRPPHAPGLLWLQTWQLAQNSPNTQLSLNIMFFRVLVLAVMFGRFPSLPLAAMTYWYEGKFEDISGLFQLPYFASYTHMPLPYYQALKWGWVVRTGTQGSVYLCIFSLQNISRPRLPHCGLVCFDNLHQLLGRMRCGVDQEL